MKKDIKRLTISLPPELLYKVRIAAAKKEISMSELIQSLILKYLESNNVAR